MSKPNIVFLFTDDQRFDTINALGNGAISTPNLDALVESGTAFTNGYIMGGSCGAVCMPSRAMLHTGRSLYRIEKQGQSIPEDHAMLGEVMQGAGYATFGTGKWHNGKRAYARSFTAGGDIMFGGMSDHWNVPAYHFDPTGEYAMTPIVKNPAGDNTVTWQNLDHISAGKHSTDLFAEATIEFISNQPTDEPFFSYTSFQAPHDPRSMPDEYLRMYDPEDVELPPNFAPVHAFDNGWMTGRDEQLAGFPRTEVEVRRHKAEYYAMISHLDAAVGRIQAAVEARGTAENTIVVFAGDNGLSVGRHGLMGKQSLYDHSVHVPLIMAGPGVPTGERREAFAYLIDIFPTLCELTGTPVPDTVEGMSLVPAMADAGTQTRECLHFAYEDLHRGIRDRQHKLIEYVVAGRHTQTQLFDLVADPHETTNLAGDPAHADTLARLRGELKRWQTDYADTSEQGQAFWGAYEG